jgi:phosphate transport system permease protein
MRKEKFYRTIFNILAYVSLLILLAIVVVIFKESFPVFKKVGVLNFIFGKSWYPTYEPPEFGILPLIIGTAVVTLGSIIVSVPLGVGSAVYIHEIASSTQRAVLKPIIEILAAIPSIIYGFFGMVVVAPFLQQIFDLPTGLNIFTASLILGFMSIPTVCSISEDALSYVPKSFKEASYALGANKWQTITKVILPAAGSGISTAIILGISRSIGETMTVLLVAGNAAVIPKTIFDPVRPMTSTIAAEMGEAVVGSTHYHALFAIGLILFIITFMFNIVAEYFSKKFRLKLGLGR